VAVFFDTALEIVGSRLGAPRAPVPSEWSTDAVPLGSRARRAEEAALLRINVAGRCALISGDDPDRAIPAEYSFNRKNPVPKNARMVAAAAIPSPLKATMAPIPAR
jgi:hypothetical protein